MQTMEAIRARRSVRKYKAEAVPREQIERLLEAAMLAPSAVNSRPWEFVVTEKREILQRLTEAHPASRMLLTASWAIAWQQDCAAAAENILLAAADMGLGTCWCGCYPAEPRTSEVQKVLGVTSVPVALIAVGVPDEAPAQKGFYDPSRITFLYDTQKGARPKAFGRAPFCAQRGRRALRCPRGCVCRGRAR